MLKNAQPLQRRIESTEFHLEIQRVSLERRQSTDPPHRPVETFHCSCTVSRRHEATSLL